MRFTATMFLLDEPLELDPAQARRAAYVAQKYFEEWLSQQKLVVTLLGRQVCVHDPLPYGQYEIETGHAYLIPKEKLG